MLLCEGHCCYAKGTAVVCIPLLLNKDTAAVLQALLLRETHCYVKDTATAGTALAAAVAAA
jgi:hypothetical protein